MPDSVDSPAPLKMATPPFRKASASTPNARVSKHSGSRSVATASASSPDVIETRYKCHACQVCSVVVSLEPGERVPLRLLGIRDELTSRPWRPPARHWPGSPLIGGIDEQAGGTWLAVHPGIPRVACLLNARGTGADPARRRSRGDLSLRA